MLALDLAFPTAADPSALAEAGEAAVAALFGPGDDGVLFNAKDASSLRVARDGSGGPSPTGGPVGAWIDKRHLAGASVAAFMATNGITDPLACLGHHGIANSDAERPTRGTLGVTPDGVDDCMQIVLPLAAAGLTVAVAVTTRNLSAFGRIVVAYEGALGGGDTLASLVLSNSTGSWYFARGSQYAGFTTAGADGTPARLITWTDATDLAQRINGQTKSTTGHAFPSYDLTHATLFSATSAGTASKSHCPMAKLFIIDRVLAPAERTLLDRWLAA